MKYAVRITSGACRDLEDICTWIADHDSASKAGYVVDRLAQTAEKISQLPHRGSRPSELPVGIEREYRQVYFKPYRIIYEVARKEVVIHVVCDGRPNLQSMLLRRLLER
jgi:toxin ParE1/3/4